MNEYNESLSNNNKVNDIVILTVTFTLKIWNLLAPGVVVSKKHLFLKYFFFKGGGVNVNTCIFLILYFHFVINYRLLLSICGLYFWCPSNLKMLPTRLERSCHKECTLEI